MVKNNSKGSLHVGVEKALSDEPTNVFFQNRIAVEWLSTKEAAKFLALSPNALRILVHRGRVKAYKLGSRLRFRLDDLRHLLQPREA